VDWAGRELRKPRITSCCVSNAVFSCTNALSRRQLVLVRSALFKAWSSIWKLRFRSSHFRNRYPNAACDTESYIYLPLLSEMNFMPVEKYTKVSVSSVSV
jgi:hypothetical protein